MCHSLSRLEALILGVAVALGVGLSAVALFAVGSQQWPLGDSFTVSVGFANIRGVEQGTRVRIQGIDAGEVTQVLLPEAPGKDVLLKLRLDGRFRRLLRADASAQIVNDNLMGGRVLDVDPGQAAEELPDNAVLASRPTPELADLLEQATQVASEIRQGDGTAGKLLKDDEAYQELVQLLRQSRATMTSIKQDADAIKSLPVVRSYVTDGHQKLYRPECRRTRRWFGAGDLFGANRAVLTEAGKHKLDSLAPWLNGLRPKGSEVVVACYAGQGLDAESARSLTQKQSAAVCDYLTSRHKVQKMGWFHWSRKVTPVGCGNDSPPPDDPEKLPAPRVEVLVFVPQK